MDMHTNLPYQLCCHILWYGKPNYLKNILLSFPTWQDMLDKKDNNCIKIKLDDIKKIGSLLESKIVQLSLDWLSEPNHYFITIADNLYPALLKEIPRAPACLFISGNIQLLSNTQIAVVGTRKPTPYGKNQTYQLVKDLSSLGITIISGLACGIDTFAHHCTLQTNGHTIAVIGNGIDVVYPKSNKKLYQQIEQFGCLVSEYPLGMEPKAAHFPQRNRLISGLSLGTLVVEARLKSGSLITAKHALHQNREVFAIPGLISNPEAEGCHHLIKSGAKLVEQWTDIIVELPDWLKQIETAPIYKNTRQPGLNDKAAKLSAKSKQWLKLLQQQGGMTQEQALMACKTSTAEFMQMRLECELLGLISYAKGRYWHLGES